MYGNNISLCVHGKLGRVIKGCGYTLLHFVWDVLLCMLSIVSIFLGACIAWQNVI